MLLNDHMSSPGRNQKHLKETFAQCESVSRGEEEERMWFGKDKRERRWFGKEEGEAAVREQNTRSLFAEVDVDMNLRLWLCSTEAGSLENHLDSFRII